MTFKQASCLGAVVRKGEHGSMVVYADKMTRRKAEREHRALRRRQAHFPPGP